MAFSLLQRGSAPIRSDALEDAESNDNFHASTDESEWQTTDLKLGVRRASGVAQVEWERWHNEIGRFCWTVAASRPDVDLWATIRRPSPACLQPIQGGRLLGAFWNGPSTGHMEGSLTHLS